MKLYFGRKNGLKVSPAGDKALDPDGVESNNANPPLRAEMTINGNYDMTGEFWVKLMEIMMVNIVLSGDNAVVIALAARGLPVKQQKIAILWGSGGAVVLRVFLTVVAVSLLKVPFLQCVGGLMLVWIAYQLLAQDDENGGDENSHQGSLACAVKTILIADVVMSLDNTLAIAAVAKGDYSLLGLGLALSIPIVVFGSAIIMRIMDKYPIIVYGGAGLIAYTAGEMIESDKALAPLMGWVIPKVLHGTPFLGVLLTLSVLAAGWIHNLRSGRSAHDVLVADEHAAQRMDSEIAHQKPRRDK